jgi:hypothetical protein
MQLELLLMLMRALLCSGHSGACLRQVASQLAR